MGTGFEEYDNYDGLGLAELVRSKEISPGELAEEAISRIEERNPAINSVVRTMFTALRSPECRSCSRTSHSITPAFQQAGAAVHTHMTFPIATAKWWSDSRPPVWLPSARRTRQSSD